MSRFQLKSLIIPRTRKISDGILKDNTKMTNVKASMIKMHQKEITNTLKNTRKNSLSKNKEEETKVSTEKQKTEKRAKWKFEITR